MVGWLEQQVFSHQHAQLHHHLVLVCGSQVWTEIRKYTFLFLSPFHKFKAFNLFSLFMMSQISSVRFVILYDEYPLQQGTLEGHDYCSEIQASGTLLFRICIEVINNSGKTCSNIFIVRNVAGQCNTYKNSRIMQKFFSLQILTYYNTKKLDITLSTFSFIPRKI